MKIQHTQGEVIQGATLGSIRVFGVAQEPYYIYVNGSLLHTNFTYSSMKKVIRHKLNIHNIYSLFIRTIIKT